MKTLGLFLLCLLTTQAAYPRKSKRGHTYRVREAGHDGGGYQYQQPSQGGGGTQYQGAGGGGDGQYHEQSGGDTGQYQDHAAAMMMDFPPHSSGGDTMSILRSLHSRHQSPETSSGSSSSTSAGSSASADMGSDGGGYHYEAPTAQTSAPAAGSDGGSQAPVGFEEIQNFAAGASAALSASGGSHSSYNGGGGGSFGGLTLGGSMGGFGGGSYGGLSLGGSSGGSKSGGSFDFNSILNAGGHSGGSGSSDQFVGVQGEVISDEKPPSIFKYKPHFGGKDINNLPHILPPGGKSIQELQDEADAKLRSIVEKAKVNQMEVLERIAKLRTNYGFGTLGYDGYTDTRFKKMGKIDLGTYNAKDLGTSIDYNALKGSDGKLKLPVQNVYHTKTLGIHVPKPYPIKHEVAVPAPYPVPYPIAVPQHKPTAYTPLNHDDIAHLTADDGRGSGYGGFGGFSSGAHFGSGASFGGGGSHFGSGGSHFGSGSFGGSFGSNFGGIEEKGPGNPGGTSSTFSIEPSHSVSESSSIGGLPYGAGTPNAAESEGAAGNDDDGHSDFSMGEHQHQTVNTFGLPPGSSSGALSSFSHSSSTSDNHQTISSEAGTVNIPAMNFQSSHQNHERPHTEYGPPGK